MKHRIGPFVLAGGLAVSAGASAHHSAVMFDTAREIAVAGTVTRYEWRNPHVYMAVQSVAADGETFEQQIEAARNEDEEQEARWEV